MRPNDRTRGLRIAIVLFLAIGVIEFVHDSVGTCSVIEGVSMYPTFSPNDVVQAKPSHDRVDRGDVIIFTDDRGERVIKRIIALPGETVTIYRGFVYINSRRLSEPYLPRFTYTFKSDISNERPAIWQLADDQYFVLGDNRLESYDSRNFGPVERHRIHSVVSLPENTFKPGFSKLILSKTGKVIRDKPNPDHDSSDQYQTANAKI